MVAAIDVFSYHSRLDLVGYLFWVCRPFVTVFESISAHLPEREKEKRKDRREKKCPNNPNPHLLQEQ